MHRIRGRNDLLLILAELFLYCTRRFFNILSIHTSTSSNGVHRFIDELDIIMGNNHHNLRFLGWNISDSGETVRFQETFLFYIFFLSDYNTKWLQIRIYS